MSWEEDKEYTESTPQYQPEPPLWKKTWKYIVVGVICFSIGFSIPFSISNDKSKYFVERNQTLTTENHELKEKIRKYERSPAETVLVPYTVLVTEAVKESKEAAPVTDAVATETKKQKAESTVPETEAPEDNEYQVKALTNPLTKKAQAPRQVKVSDLWKVYWIEVNRSDLKGLKPDDFRFFNDYINEHFEPDACDFYVVVTDGPDLCFQFTVTKSEYVRSTCEAFAGITKTDSSQHYPYCGTGSCAIRYNDPEQFEMQALTKDEYGLEQYDDSKIYHFSEFGDDMFAQLDELQRNAR